MREYSQEEKAFFMREALKEAEKSLAKEEIPIGCVLVKDGQIIGLEVLRQEAQRYAGQIPVDLAQPHLAWDLGDLS